MANAIALVNLLGTQLNSLQLKQQELVSPGETTKLNSAVEAESKKRVEVGELAPRMGSPNFLVSG